MGNGSARGPVSEPKPTVAYGRGADLPVPTSASDGRTSHRRAKREKGVAAATAKCRWPAMLVEASPKATLTQGAQCAGCEARRGSPKGNGRKQVQQAEAEAEAQKPKRSSALEDFRQVT